ncbi:pyridoxal-dependent decarboxylase [Saccharothrix violaceirubra]|uniref:Glutamate/tyrosine decarboxylase-like PLP-dependent enzyme n=1 Tax=Saccharothrix violaceirubra TaxID=413306 RepID=A0A7W7WVZ4_9PSEU|nr:pyridoxal-dependent decarboxylase [Saccharothrix violaceirubra]MBB4965013.1 glutamate/tyrosine decarboxylase-like PLP-dependent enzyme [Saccharothrix violaceirubra]
MGDPLHAADDAVEALGMVDRAARPYLDALPHLPVRDATHAHLLDDLDGPLPEDGDGTLTAVAELLRIGTKAATHSSGPRFFHFVVGGATPAAQAADWITSLLDQPAGLWLTSPLATRAETVVLRWLKELFGLPASHGGVLTPSATFANLTGLACARFDWGRKHGVDVTADGLAGLPRMPVFSSGYVHASSRKALQLLGVGRDHVRTLSRDDAGRIDLEALDRELGTSGPAVVIANAGEVNAGDFDPVDAIADVVARHDAWLHVDGAFGLFAALSPRTAHLTAGVDRADSVAADGHKWLNVPYESGFAFVREAGLLGRAFGGWNAPYLPEPDDEFVNYNNLGPESSRRARAFPIWATLRAYGRAGHRAMVERHQDLARRLGDAVEADPDLESLAPVTVFVVCFRYAPAGLSEPELDDLNRRLGAELLDDGRVYAGTTVYRGRVALRPAIVNWRTTADNIDLLVRTVKEIGARLSGR